MDDDNLETGAKEFNQIATGTEESESLPEVTVAPTGANLASPMERLMFTFKRPGYKITAALKALFWFVFVANLVILLVYGLVATDLVEIFTDKQFNVRDTPDCLAKKAEHPSAGDDYRCRSGESTGRASVLAPLCVVAGMHVIILGWIMFDWIRIFNWIRFGRDSDWLLNLRIVRAFRKLKIEFLYPHTHHYVSLVLKDYDETLWKTKFFTATNTVWFFLMSGMLAQTNIYILVYSALLGCSFDITGYLLEVERRRRHNPGDVMPEIGILRGWGHVIAHWISWLVPAICWCVQLHDLYVHSHPTWEYLTLFLCLNIYILAQEVLAGVFNWWSRGAKATHDDQSSMRITHRELWHGILWVAHATMYGGVLPYILIMGTSNIRILN